MYRFVKNYKGSDGFIEAGTKVKTVDKKLIERGIVVKIEEPTQNKGVKNGSKNKTTKKSEDK